MQHTMHILDRTGHTTLTWDSDLEADVNEALREAETAFNLAVAQNQLIYKRDGDEYSTIRTFDPEADIFVTPQIVGG